MKNVLIFGDSNTWGYDSARYVPEADAFQRMDETERWPALVRSRLGSGYHIIEDALNGRTLVWDDPYMPNRNGLQVLLIVPAPTHPDIATLREISSFGPTAYRRSCELGKLYRDIAERNHCGFIDCAELNFEINTVDGLYYSLADHAKLAPIVVEKIREMLE